MFSSDPRQNVLNRLGNKENVHKSKSDSRVENLDYKHGVSKKPNSPHRLPKLETPPSSSEMYDVSHDLRRGKQEVVPSVLPHLLESQLPKNVKMIEDEVMGLQDHTTGLYSQILPNMYGQPAIVTSQPHPVYHVPVLPVYYAPTYPQAGVKQPQMWQNRFMNDKQNRRIQATSVKPRYLSRNEAAGVIQRNFRHWQSRKGPRDPCYRVSEDVCTDFIEQGVTTLIKQAASSVYFKFIISTPTAIGTPTSRICDDIICEVVDSECRHVMKSKVKALIEENRTYTGEHGWLEYFVLTTIHPLLQIIVLEAIDECQYGDTLSSLITEVTDDMANSVIINVWQEMYMNHYRSTHKEMISRYAQQHLLDSLCLDHLLSSLTGNNLPFYFKNYTHQVLDGMIAGSLMNQFLAVETDREETKSNMAVRKYQEAVFADMALDVVLAELEAHLDEDSRDLLEIEQRIDQDIFVDDFKST